MGILHSIIMQFLGEPTNIMFPMHKEFNPFGVKDKSQARKNIYNFVKHIIEHKDFNGKILHSRVSKPN